MRSPGGQFTEEDRRFMRRALLLASKGYGGTSPNPMVGCVIVRDGQIIGEGWHRRAGEAHAEVHAIEQARKKRRTLEDSTLYVTLEPCSTRGRTGACTTAILESGIRQVIAAAQDPNPKHEGKGFEVLRKGGARVRAGLLAEEAKDLNETFNHWIVRRTPFVLLKAAMSLDGRIATRSGESKWITGEKARAFGMRLRLGADAILAGVNTIVRDDPALTLRPVRGMRVPEWKQLRRIILDPEGRTPLGSKVLATISDQPAEPTLVVVTSMATPATVSALRERAEVLVAPRRGRGRLIDLHWLMKVLGEREITSLLVEGGGETHAAFFARQVGHRAFLFLAPIIIGGWKAARGVGGDGIEEVSAATRLKRPAWTRLGKDLLLSGLIDHLKPTARH